MPGRSDSEYHAEIVDYVLWDDSLHTVPVGSTIRDEVEPEAVQGVHIHAYNTADSRDDHWWWIWSYDVLDWDGWDYQIEINADMHNIAFA